MPPGLPHNCSVPLVRQPLSWDPPTIAARTPDTRPIGCYVWQNKTMLNISLSNPDPLSQCLDVIWKTTSYEPRLRDCIDIGERYGKWYGGFNKLSAFPLGQEEIDETLYLPGQMFGSMTERLWISSKGVAVKVNGNHPLHVSVVKQPETGEYSLCLENRLGFFEGDRYLNYSVCQDGSTGGVLQRIMGRYYPEPVEGDFGVQYSHPIYNLESDANNLIQQLNLSNLQYNFLLDNAKNIVDTTPVPSTIPSVSVGYRVSPYISVSDPLFRNNTQSNMWLTSTDMDVPRLFLFNNETCALLNMSSDAAQQVVKGSLPAADMPVQLSQAFIGDIRGQEFYNILEANQTFQPYIENFFTVIDNSTTGPIVTRLANGLTGTRAIFTLPEITDLQQAVISMMQTSMMGYRFFSSGLLTDNLSSKEFIRALQFSIFSPVLHVSESALNSYNDSQVVHEYKQWLTIRNKTIFKLILEHFKHDHAFEPLIVPTWWYEQSTQPTYRNDQFMFTRYYLVAPLLDPEATSREVYFPEGYWLRIWLNHESTSYDDPRERKFYIGPSTEIVSNLGYQDLLIFRFEAPLGEL